MIKSRVGELFDKRIHWLQDYSTMNSTGRTDEWLTHVSSQMALPLNLDPTHQSADVTECFPSTSPHLAVCTSKTMYTDMHMPTINF